MNAYSDSFFKAVGEFNAKFGIPTAASCYVDYGQSWELRRHPQFLPIDEHTYRRKFMQEELEEFDEACAAGDLAKAADALVDLTYVVLGTAHLMGLPFDELFARVQAANLAKERAASASESKAKTGRGHRFDVVKPADWTPPKIREALVDAGWEG